MKLLFIIIFALAAGVAGVFGQTVVNVKSLTLSPEATTAVNSFMVTQVAASTGLSGSITAAAMTVLVDDGAVMNGSDIIRIDGEAMQITAKNGKTLTVTRASLGTTAAVHADKAIVQVLKYKTPALLFQAHLTTLVGQIMDQVGYSTKATQDAVISTAQAAKDVAKAGAVQ